VAGNYTVKLIIQNIDNAVDHKKMWRSVDCLTSYGITSNLLTFTFFETCYPDEYCNMTDFHFIAMDYDILPIISLSSGE